MEEVCVAVKAMIYQFLCHNQMGFLMFSSMHCLDMELSARTHGDWLPFDQVNASHLLSWRSGVGAVGVAEEDLLLVEPFGLPLFFFG